MTRWSDLDKLAKILDQATDDYLREQAAADHANVQAAHSWELYQAAKRDYREACARAVSKP